MKSLTPSVFPEEAAAVADVSVAAYAVLFEEETAETDMGLSERGEVGGGAGRRDASRGGGEVARRRRPGAVNHASTARCAARAGSDDCAPCGVEVTAACRSDARSSGATNDERLGSVAADMTAIGLATSMPRPGSRAATRLLAELRNV